MITEKKWDTDVSKLNRIELLKLKKDGLDMIQEIIDRYSSEEHEAISEDDKILFKWAGLYQQKPNTGHYMLRVTIPAGFLNSEQARVLAAIGRDYCKGQIHLTTRQSVQFHWLTLQVLPDVFRRLASVNLSSFEACGDCPGPIVGNPLAGIDPDELLDTTPLVKDLHQFFFMNRDFSNLPRKFKIAIFANPYNSGHAEINDLSFSPAVKMIDGSEVLGFHVWVGGGLSARAQMAKQLNLFVRPEEVLKVATCVVSLFRDHGFREKRNRARLRFLVADWGIEKFQEELVKLTGELPERGIDKTTGWNGGHYFGVHKQKQPGLNYVGLSIPVGKVSSDDLEQLAGLADEYGNGEIRTCNSQNVILPNIPDHKQEALLQEPLLTKFSPYPKAFTGYAVSCTGTEFCNYAIVETRNRMEQIASYLDEHVKQDDSIRIHMTGCPNSCGQREIADIGLQAALVKNGDTMIEAFDIYVGGNLGPGAAFNSKLSGRIPAGKLEPVLAELIRYYNKMRGQNEKFHAFTHRIGLSAIQQKLDSILTANIS